MKKNIAKVTLVRNSQYGWYRREADYNPDDELLILEQYFGSELGSDPSQVLIIRKYILKNEIGGNAIEADIIDGKIRLSDIYVPNLKEPVLTQEELLILVDKWIELVAAKVDKIVITNDNGKFSIGTE